MTERDFKAWLKQQREKSGLTQAELAARIKTTSMTVSRWERGEQVPRPYYQRKMARLFGVSITDLTQYANPKHDRSLLWYLPYLRNIYFTGHERTLKTIHEALVAEKSAILTHALSGLGGTGKTQLAVEYASRHHEEYQAILWAGAESREALLTDMTEIASLLDLSIQDEHDLDQVMYAVRHWLETHGKWLLILDNVEDFSILEHIAPQGGEGYTGHILITTQAQAVGTRAKKIAVETMEAEEGATLVLRRAKKIPEDAAFEMAPEIERAGAKTINAELGGLPLALDQAGAFIEAAMCSAQEYLDIYRMKRAELLQRRGGEDSGHPLSVSTTLSLAIDKVKQINPAAVDLLTFFAHLHPDAIPEDILTIGSPELGTTLQTIATDPLLLHEAIEALGKYSLIRRNADDGILSMHRLVKAVILDSIDEKLQQTWAEQTVRAINRCCTSAALLPLDEYYLPHMLEGTRLIEKWNLQSEIAAHLLDQTATTMRERGLYAEAQPICFAAMNMYKTLLGTDHPGNAHCLLNGARLYMHLGYDDLVELTFERARMLYEQSLGHDHPDMLEILNDGALFYLHRGRIDLAEACCEQALVICSKHRVADSPIVARCVNITAQIYFRLGRYDRGLEFHLRALAMREQLLGPEHLDVSESLADLAVLIGSVGNLLDAEHFIKRAIAIREQVLGPDHPSTADALETLADILLHKGELKQAEKLEQRVLTIRKQKLRENHLDIATSHSQLAIIYQQLGKRKEAERHYQQARNIRKRNIILPPGETTVTMAEYLIPALKEMGREKEAARLEELTAFVRASHEKYGIAPEGNKGQEKQGNT